MIKVKQEKELKLSAGEINAILSFAFGEATNNGFVNRFVFERAMYVYAYVVLMGKNIDVDDDILDDNVLNVWNTILLDGTVERMTKEYENELVVIQNAAADIFEDYRDYQRSVRGVAGALGDAIDNVLGQLSSIAKDGLTPEQYREIMDIASKWGLNGASNDNTADLTVVE